MNIHTKTALFPVIIILTLIITPTVWGQKGGPKSGSGGFGGGGDLLGDLLGKSEARQQKNKKDAAVDSSEIKATAERERRRLAEIKKNTDYFIDSLNNQNYRAEEQIKEKMESQRLKSENNTNYFVDTRDSTKYLFVKIGGTTWMAENLNYATDDSRCYWDDNFNCNKYGRLYDWNEAVTVCPDGWYLPDRDDWEDLIKHTGGYSEAAKKLKAKSGWNKRNGTDDFGFSALPGGYFHHSGGFGRAGYQGYWWTSTKRGKVYDRVMYDDEDFVQERDDGSGYFDYSVRCVQGSPAPQEKPQTKKNEGDDSVSLSSKTTQIKMNNNSDPDTLPPPKAADPKKRWWQFWRVTPKKPQTKINVDTGDGSYPLPQETPQPKTIAINGSGTFTDERDGKIYKTVTIGGQTWMAENLNYETPWGKSWCYADIRPNCDKYYGRLYDWNTARRACPSGWHLPSNQEWEELVATAGSPAATSLKAKALWEKGGIGNDKYGFSALPGGYRYNIDSGYHDAGKFGYWWTFTVTDTYKSNDLAYGRYINYDNGVVAAFDNYKSNGFSVRCVKD
jgi:uncharacterized protein (TIGR02145 family)